MKTLVDGMTAAVLGSAKLALEHRLNISSAAGLVTSSLGDLSNVRSWSDLETSFKVGLICHVGLFPSTKKCELKHCFWIQSLTVFFGALKVVGYLLLQGQTGSW